MNQFDAIIGLSIWLMAFTTVGEVGSNLVHVLYSAPVTIFQPKGIPPHLGITAFTIGYFFACESCIMHQFVSANRMLAVCTPLKYRHIFTKAVSRFLIALCWIDVTVVLSLIIGYSPTFYQYVFVKCSPDIDRNYSLAGTIVNRACFCLCLMTMITDLITLVRIIYVRMTMKMASQDQAFRRDVRFFGQTSVQNLTMMITLSLIVLVNNSKREDGIIFNILTFYSLILTHLNNALALILFNPEVRRFLGIRFKFWKRADDTTTTVNSGDRANTGPHGSW